MAVVITRALRSTGEWTAENQGEIGSFTALDQRILGGLICQDPVS